MKHKYHIGVRRLSIREATFDVVMDGEVSGEAARARDAAREKARNTDYNQFPEDVTYEALIQSVEPIREKTELNLRTSAYEGYLILRVAQRAMSLGIHTLSLGIHTRSILPCTEDEQQWVTDIVLCHNHGCPLMLAELLAASADEFTHDMIGIRSFLNRNTGKLEGIFHPRYALNQ
jgi:hypothetical protein